MPEERQTQTGFSVLVICFVLASLMVAATTETETLTENIPKCLFWIGIMSFTDRAAILLIFDKEHSNKVKLMCLVGIFYGFFVDRSVFSYEFKAEHIEAGIAILALIIATLVLQPTPAGQKYPGHDASPAEAFNLLG